MNIPDTDKDARCRALAWTVNIIAAASAIAALVLWQSLGPGFDVTRNIPGMDRAGSQALSTTEPRSAVGEFFVQGDGTPATAYPHSWPHFRGPDHDNVCRQGVSITHSWHAGAGPETAWKIPLGEGHAAPAIHKGRVYVLDYDEEKRGDALRCLSLADGKEIWRRWYRNPVKRNHGMSRTIPAVDDNHVVTIGPTCLVMCVSAENGDLLWSLDLVKDYGTTVPLWYAGQCPIIDGGVAVVAPAGNDILMMGIDCSSGKILWQTPNHDSLKMSHSSIIPMTLAGKRTYVYSALGAIVGVSAENEDAGTLLWSSREWNRKVIAPSPIPLDADRLMITAGYGGGTMVLRISQKDGVFSAEVLQTIRPGQGLASEQQTPIVIGNSVYAIMPKDGGTLRQQFVCATADNLTEIIWSSGPEHRFGLGPFIMADGKFFILNDEGTMNIVDATAGAFRLLASFKVLDGHDAWGPIAVSGTKMLLRDSTSLACIDFSRPSQAIPAVSTFRNVPSLLLTAEQGR